MSHTIENFVNKPTVVCLDCGLSIEAGSEVTAVKKWNTRKPVDDVVEALEEKLSFFNGKSYGNDVVMGIASGMFNAIEIVKEHLT